MITTIYKSTQYSSQQPWCARR